MRRGPARCSQRRWIDRALAFVPPGAPVLDLGCGAGEPIAAYLIFRGHPVCGVDFAAPMLALARARFPDQPRPGCAGAGS